MESGLGGNGHYISGMGTGVTQTGGNRSLEWNLNDWDWDGDLFIARPVNSVPTNSMVQQISPLETGVLVAGNSSNSSASCSDQGNAGAERGESELGKRSRFFLADGDTSNVEQGSFTLKVDKNGCPSNEREVGNWKGASGKKTKLDGSASSSTVCQVEGCGSDLSYSKDYHRRHKVCEIHSKANRALVRGAMQRFCQQCSRFHSLQEFDEGKRSCRRRLAGHNKRRRKTNPDTVGNGNLLYNDQTSRLLIDLVKIVSNMHSNRSNQTPDQNALSHILKSIESQTVKRGGINTYGLLQEAHDRLNDISGNSEVISALLSNRQDPPSGFQHRAQPVSEMPHQTVQTHNTRGVEAPETSARPIKMINFDLNDIYIDSDDGTENIEQSPASMNLNTSSPDCPSWVQLGSHQSSPPLTSGNSDSASGRSPSSSSEDAQSRTGRIVFKLFGKEPTDFPIAMRAQILDWLSHRPTDTEGYIRPGCVILTVYLRQDEAAWEELCSDLSFNLSRLFDLSDDAFWTMGWIYIRVQQQIAFIHNGQAVVETSLPLKSSSFCEILSVKPIAISASERAQFSVKGINLSRPTTRLLCAVEGKYLVQEGNHELLEGDDGFEEHGELQCVNFSCTIPEVTGRGFIEIEDDGLGSSFFPFIVAEDEVCLEIRMLENELEFTGTDPDIGVTKKIEAKNQAMDFINEIGWLLHRIQVKSRLDGMDPNTDLFPLIRFKWLIEFSMDHEWCAVVKKLLNIFMDGTVGLGEHASLNLALADMCMLHRAVRKNSKPLVEFLLRYIPESASDKLGSEWKAPIDHGFLFRPDAMGPAGLTPLHIAAGKDGSEDVLNALTEDPGMVGLKAWKSARDSTGCTPEDYARLRGHYTYIHHVQRKLHRKLIAAEHVVVDIPDAPSDDNTKTQKERTLTAAFEIGKTNVGSTPNNCKLCVQKLAYKKTSRSVVYRPALLSMVAIAAVCVCMALLFKSYPEVLYVFRPFAWETLSYGTS